MNLLNSAADLLVSAINLPLFSASADWQLFWVSLVSGVIFLLIYGMVSSQARLKQVKRRIGAALLEVVLYRHDLRVLLSAQRDLLMGGLRYFVLAVPPILVLMIPCILILSNLNLRYGSRGLEVGESALLTVQLADRKALYRTSLEAPVGVEVSPPVRMADTNRIVWRLRPTSPQQSELRLKFGNTGAALLKDLLVGQGHRYVPAASYADWFERLLYPDSSLSSISSQVSSVTISYPERQASLFGLEMHWIAIFAIVSILSGIVASRVFRIEI